MTVTVHPSTIHGEVMAPASKSSMQRVCALALLHQGETFIHNPGKSSDDLAAVDIIQKLGAIVEMKNEKLRIKSEGISSFPGIINCGESGLGIRMFTSIAALSAKEITINGSGSLLKRPMHFFDEVLPQLGVSVQSNGGCLPLTIKGPLQPTDITIDGSMSSQFLTGLLIAYGAAATKPVTITVKDLKSKPYIDLTLQMMQEFGYGVENDDYKYFTVKPVNQLTDKPVNYSVEGDWSGAAFLLVAAAIAGSITVKGLDVDSAQADKAVLNALKDHGAAVLIDNGNVMVSPPPANAGAAFHFDATDCPDLFPPLVALAAYGKGTSVIKGVSRLQHKESDRSLSLQQEFGKFGVTIKVNGDEMMIEGRDHLTGTTVHSHHDHRIAMACAVAALRANGNTVIEGAEAVSKSYPDFYEHLNILNADVSLPITN